MVNGAARHIAITKKLQAFKVKSELCAQHRELWLARLLEFEQFFAGFGASNICERQFNAEMHLCRAILFSTCKSIQNTLIHIPIIYTTNSALSRINCWYDSLHWLAAFLNKPWLIQRRYRGTSIFEYIFYWPDDWLCYVLLWLCSCWYGTMDARRVLVFLSTSRPIITVPKSTQSHCLKVKRPMDGER